MSLLILAFSSSDGLQDHEGTVQTPEGILVTVAVEECKPGDARYNRGAIILREILDTYGSANDWADYWPADQAEEFGP